MFKRLLGLIKNRWIHTDLAPNKKINIQIHFSNGKYIEASHNYDESLTFDVNVNNIYGNLVRWFLESNEPFTIFNFANSKIMLDRSKIEYIQFY